MQSREDLVQWDGQSPPKGVIASQAHDLPETRKLPRFGYFQLKRQKVCG